MALTFQLPNIFSTFVAALFRSSVVYATWASKRVRLQGDYKNLKDLTVLDNIFVYFICLLVLTSLLFLLKNVYY